MLLKLKGIVKTLLGARKFYKQAMACSRFEYVKDFELDDKVVPNCWIVIRIDGKSFHKFSKNHEFEKPNDARALNLMNFAAIQVMKEFNEIIISYGESDEYSFVFHKTAEVYSRRSSKIMSGVNSLFTAAYVRFWPQFFPNTSLKSTPSFDGRLVLYPSDENLRDYLSWRQADCHINNLYNTTFWALVQKGGLTGKEAMERLKGTLAADKNEILFSEFGINYNNEDAFYRKGTILVKKQIKIPGTNQTRVAVIPVHEDLIGDEFWRRNDELLTRGQPKYVELGEKLHVMLQKQLEVDSS